jgi:hypothetical protein
MAVSMVGDRARGLGDGGKPEIGADGNRRVELEDGQQQGRHQRAAADARQADDRANAESTQYSQQVHGVPKFACCGRAQAGRDCTKRLYI